MLMMPMYVYAITRMRAGAHDAVSISGAPLGIFTILTSDMMAISARAMRPPAAARWKWAANATPVLNYRTICFRFVAFMASRKAERPSDAHASPRPSSPATALMRDAYTRTSGDAPLARYDG